MDFGLHAVCLSKTTMTGLELLLSLFLFGVFVFLFLVNPAIRITISLNRCIGIYQLFFPYLRLFYWESC